MTTEDSPRTLKTVETTVEIIWELEKLDGATVTELSNRLDLSKGAVYNHLATLKQQHLVVQNDTTYNLSLHFQTLGEYVKHNTPLYNAGKQEIDRLAEETGEYAHLMAEEYGRGIHAYKASGENAVGKQYHLLNLEQPDHLHFTATGKSVLAYLDDEKVDWIIDEYGLPQQTENTITSRDELRDALASVREQGYAVNDEEEITGLRAVGAPIRDSDGDVRGAISVSAPISRLKGETFESELPEKVIQAANVIELNLETSSME
ncbi:IclR family transcriptional regulator [Haloarculaceae archaeon H-GB2-1]|nr:IclR family transcriptional regulator [Haloarculaceae archaeon H-GB1-1]MEA5386426.1 IclR family transcriptional regulator [Haloarculaceae archaeon H-GB11]MEA5407937.1 IclR family transcriptional regulator [Haloarculaceae archaeon H-GB2-1]